MSGKANFKKTPISDYQSSFGLIIIWRLLNKLGKDYRKEGNISIIKVFYFTVLKDINYYSKTY